MQRPLHRDADERRSVPTATVIPAMPFAGMTRCTSVDSGSAFWSGTAIAAGCVAPPAGASNRSQSFFEGPRLLALAQTYSFRFPWIASSTIVNTFPLKKVQADAKKIITKPRTRQNRQCAIGPTGETSHLFTIETRTTPNAINTKNDPWCKIITVKVGLFIRIASLLLFC